MSKLINVEQSELVAEKRALAAEIESLNASVELIKYHHNKLVDQLQSKLNRLQLNLSDLVGKK